MYIFESDAVISDFPMQENHETFKEFNTDCWFTTLVLLFVPDIKKAQKRTSQRSFAGFVFFVPSTLILKNAVMKTFWPKQ